MVNVPSNVGDPDPLKLPGASSGPALPAPILLTHSATSQDLPPPSPKMFPPSSSFPPHRQHPIPVRSPRSRPSSPQPPAPSSRQTTPLKDHFPLSAQPKIVDRWANGPVIGVKPVPTGKGHQKSSPVSPTRGTFGKIALPGLSRARTPPPRGTDNLGDHVPSPVSGKGPPQEEPQERNSVERRPNTDKPQPRRPAVPHKPSRIPSTGNRATVMDVAQVWSEHERQSSQNVASPRSASPSSPLEPRSTHPVGTSTRLDHQGEPEKGGERERERQEQEEPPRVVDKTAIAGRGTQTPIPAPSTAETPEEPEEEDTSLKLPGLLTPMEKRKSSWEKYSELIMPALEEEWTPIPSPVPTLNKPPEMSAKTKGATTPETERSGESKVDYLPLDLLSTTLEPEGKTIKVSPADLITFGKTTSLSSLSVLTSC